MRLSRRKFVGLAALGGLGVLVGSYFVAMAGRRMTPSATHGERAEVFLISTSDRRAGVRALIDRFDMSGYRGRSIALKANFNSADPFPASTHIDTLESIVTALEGAGARSITLAERSGMGKTREVLEKLRVFDLSRRLGFKVVVLDEEDRDGWMKIDADGTHWLTGFFLSRHFLTADKVVQTCCLKTHRFGGHFTMSLKNSIGLIAKQVPGVPYDYMLELHASPYQRLMVAEVNRFYDADLVIMDAIEAFVKGGPDRGDLVEPNLMLASRDRVAIDAVGIAILRSYGSTREVMEGGIFELDQIRQSSEIGVGVVRSASNIALIPVNDESTEAAKRIEEILMDQG